MKVSIISVVFVVGCIWINECYAQVCTLTANQTFANLGTATCAEGGNPSTNDLIITAGFTLSTTSNNQTITYSIEVSSGGTLDIDHNNATINGSIKVKDGGSFLIDGSTTLPSGAILAVEDGALVDSGATGSDRLTIGGTVILKGNGGCTDVDQAEDSSPPYCSADGFTGPTGFDENGELPSVLPIVLGYFESLVTDQGVSLEWQTITEENFDFFVIERSENGSDFYEIGTVPGHGNSLTPIDYSFDDPNPVFGTNYYRLRAVDYDGTFEIFQTLTTEFIPSSLNAIIFPNPTESEFIKINLSLPKAAIQSTARVYDLQGTLILEEKLSKGLNELKFSQPISKGFYLTKIQIDNYTSVHKLIIR